MLSLGPPVGIPRFAQPPELSSKKSIAPVASKTRIIFFAIIAAKER
jgi:hypothetical protein